MKPWNISYRISSPSREARVVFFGRLGGVGPGPSQELDLGRKIGDDDGRVRENERMVLRELQTNRLYLPEQVHGPDVTVLAEEPAEGAARGAKADAVVTSLPCVAVGVLTADCVPILIVDEEVRAVAAVHAGWRGLAAGIIGRAIQVLSDIGPAPSELKAFIGPAIGPCCYEVGEDLADLFGNDVPGGKTGLCKKAGKSVLDLPMVAFAQLNEAGGIPRNRISLLRRCTACEERVFFSNRRGLGKSGRQLSAVVIKP